MTRFLYWAAPCLAAMIAVFTLIPAEVWAHPAVDQVYNGFDPNLVYVSNGGAGSVSVTSSAVELHSQPGAVAATTLLTTPMQRLAVSMHVTISQDQGSLEPLRIGVWSPLKGSGYFVVFGQLPTHEIMIQGFTGGRPGRTMGGGDLVRQVSLGTYTVGGDYRIALLMDRTRDVISYQVFNGDALIGHDSVSRHDFPAIFDPLRLSLTASSVGGRGAGQAVLQRYQVTLLHERFWTSKVADGRAQIILLALAMAVLLLVFGTAVQNRHHITAGIARVRSWPTALSGSYGRLGLTAGLVFVGILVYLAGNAFLFRFAGHPFDMGGAKVFAYVARTYGPVQLYYLPNVVPLAPVWNGIPYMEAGDPYGPVSSYLFAGIGALHGLIFGTTGSLNGLQLEAVIKSVNVLFGLGDAALIYLILGRIGLNGRWRLIAAALFLFNPAAWFSMSVWGQTHVISIFFVLAAIWFIESGVVTWAWLALIASCLTRPQMLVFAVLLGIVVWRKFGWRANMVGLSWAIIVTFLLLVPLTIASSPSLPVDLIINNFHIQEAGGNDPTATTVSQGAYSIWPLITYLTEGQSGLQRIYAPSLDHLIGPLSYQRASQILASAAVVLVAMLLLVRRRERLERGGYIPAVAVGITAFLMLLTGIVSTHFLLPLPFLLLCRRWVDPIPYLFVAVIWTITTLVPMFGDMGVILTSGNLLLAPAYKPITEFAIHTYTWDRFITAGVTANILALIWLGWLAIRRHQATYAESAA